MQIATIGTTANKNSDDIRLGYQQPILEFLRSNGDHLPPELNFKCGNIRLAVLSLYSQPQCRATDTRRSVLRRHVLTSVANAEYLMETVLEIIVLCTTGLKIPDENGKIWYLTPVGPLSFTAGHCIQLLNLVSTFDHVSIYFKHALVLGLVCIPSRHLITFNFSTISKPLLCAH